MGKYLPRKRERSAKITSAVRHELFSRTCPFRDKYFPILTINYISRQIFPHINHKLYISRQIFPHVNYKLYISRQIFPHINHKLYISRQIFPQINHKLYISRQIFPQINHKSFITFPLIISSTIAT